MRYTRPQLLSIVKGNFFVEEASLADDTKVKSCMNSLMSGLVAKGLTFLEASDSIHCSGRPEHTYSAWDLYRYLGVYILSVEHHKLTIKKSVAHALLDHFEFLGYDGALGTVVSNNRQKREMIFGKEASDRYYKEQGA